VANTAGDDNGAHPPAAIDQGAVQMGYYNMANGDAPILHDLAQHYAISDNYHQAVQGGTGANHIALGTGFAGSYQDAAGKAATPPANQIENPNPKPGTNNNYTQDGYSGGSYSMCADHSQPGVGAVFSYLNSLPYKVMNNCQPGRYYLLNNYNAGYNIDGTVNTSSPYTLPPQKTDYVTIGNSLSAHHISWGWYGEGYSNCSDTSQPGVGPIVTYLGSLTPAINPNCEPGHYYLLNNYNPGYFGDGGDAYKNTNAHNTPFTVPGTTQRSIADELLEKNISWKTYFDQWDAYLSDKYQQNYGTVGSKSDQYCNICNPFQYSKQIMTNAAVRTAHLKDTRDLYNDIKSGSLPAVSFVKPSGWADGHPASSKWDLFEGFVKKIVDDVKANPELWDSTAIFITTDEGGGYYDSGYIQPLDFFGDGTRIPLIVVSKYTKPGHISHSYADHVSLLKFIERNWVLSPVTKRSRDNFPNPISTEENPYVPTNSPAISDLFDLFNF